jgi:hypothetical protein
VVFAVNNKAGEAKRRVDVEGEDKERPKRLRKGHVQTSPTSVCARGNANHRQQAFALVDE